MNRHAKKPLYRKVNTRTRGVHHGDGGEYKWERHRKRSQADQPDRSPMHQKHRHGFDYTPLFKFLLSRIGRDWDEVHGEAVSRLDQPEPIFWMVARYESEKKPTVRIGGNSYYSGLYIDEDNRLAVVDPSVTLDDMKPGCACCTHTFNGVPFVNEFDAE